MSLPKKVTVSCPKCGESLNVTAFESINTDYSENITEQIISGALFSVECHKCGEITPLYYDTLYHDIKHGAMIWVLHDNSSEYNSKVAELRNSPNILRYQTTRIVNSMNELREKVACLENNRDDRVIELCKVFLTYNLLSQQPNFSFNNAFYSTFNGEERVYIYNTNGKEISCKLTNDTYSLLCDMYYNSKCASNFKSYYAIVNYEWAEKILKNLMESETNVTNNGIKESDIPRSETKTAEKLVCPFCKETTPEDSDYCPFCGNKLDKAPIQNSYTTVKTPHRNENPTHSNSSSSINPPNKSTFLQTIKQKLRNDTFTKVTLALIIVSALLLISIIINFVQASDIEYYQSRIYHLREEYGDEALFYHEHVVCVTNINLYYHKYGCNEFDDSKFWIFSVKHAEQQGYKPCPYCCN